MVAPAARAVVKVGCGGGEGRDGRMGGVVVDWP